MPPTEHPWDGISEDLFDWMQGEVDYHVDALRSGYRTPFSAQTSERDKLDYYRRQMYKVDPDGTVRYDQPNPEGRDYILKRYGTQTYAQIIEATRPKQGRQTPTPEADDQEALDTGAPMPPMPEDTEPV